MSPSSTSPKPLSLVIASKGNIDTSKKQPLINDQLTPIELKSNENYTQDKSFIDKEFNSNLEIKSTHSPIQKIDDQKQLNSSIVRPTIQIQNILKKNNDEKYTFVPIQLPNSCSKSNILSNNSNNPKMNVICENVQPKISSSLTKSTNSSFYSLVQKNNSSNDHNSVPWSSLPTPNLYHESSISNSSNNTKIDIKDSDYHITAQLNSDSEPCI
jgi:hypothetical protein